MGGATVESIDATLLTPWKLSYEPWKLKLSLELHVIQISFWFHIKL